MSEPTPDLLDVDVETGETVLDVYERHGWGDGLPLEAPTPERVNAMLATLGNVDPDEVIAVLPPRSGEATRRTIKRTAIILGVLAIGWYFGFMAMRLL